MEGKDSSMGLLYLRREGNGEKVSVVEGNGAWTGRDEESGSGVGGGDGFGTTG